MLQRFSRFAVLPLMLMLMAQTVTVYGGTVATGEGGVREDRQSSNASADTVERVRRLVEEVRTASFPELAGAVIEVKQFDHEADYFRTVFSFSRFLLCRRMNYIIKVNPKVFDLQAPEEGVRAIIAHELGHVFYYKKGNRMRLLGLVRLISKGYTAGFERWTDLQAISRGYAGGLKAYREWLYKNVPRKKLEEKRRSYFSPEEIDAIQSRIQSQPELLRYWLKHVPRNLKEIEERN